MTISQFGLVFDILGSVFLACDSYMKTSALQENSISVGYGRWSTFWRISASLGYIFLAFGFLLQLLGSGTQN